MPGDFDLVKERVDIVQLIGERVPLRKAGRAYKGLCPFHAEKTPSFTVDPDRRTYKCFGCGEGGDAFTWLEKMDGLEPVEALNQLAERAGVELSRRPPEAREREKRLQAAHDTALFYFRQALRGTDHGKAVARYLEERGIASASVEAFGLGYAPDLRDGLLAYLRKKGYADEEVVASGLVVSTDRGLFDRFRDRLTVPIRDARGHVIAFGGRAMNASQTAKYVNSPQTVLFNKSATLYALDAARTGIRKAGEVVIVEGYFDAIACHQAGIENVVASMGTALTEEQYRVLDEMKIERAVVAFDADAAGQRSAEKRGRELARIAQRVRRGVLSTRTGLQLYVATLVEGDPDDLARSDPARLRTMVAEARPVLQFVIDEVAGRYDLGGSPDARRRFLAETLPLLADEPDVIARELYLGTLSRLTGVDQETLRAQAVSARSPEPARRGALERPEEPVRGAEGKQTTSAERYLMAELAQFPEEAARIDLAPDDLQDPDHRAIFEHLRSGGRPNADLPAHLAATMAALRAVAPEHEVTADTGRAIEITALRLREQNLRRRLGEAKAQLSRAADGDVGGQDDEVARVADELERVMRSRESATVLRASDDMETE